MKTLGASGNTKECERQREKEKSRMLAARKLPPSLEPDPVHFLFFLGLVLTRSDKAGRHRNDGQEESFTHTSLEAGTWHTGPHREAQGKVR